MTRNSVFVPALLVIVVALSLVYAAVLPGLAVEGGIAQVDTVASDVGFAAVSGAVGESLRVGAPDGGLCGNPGAPC